MPIYEYECGTCGRVHEILQKMSDKPLTDCPECSGKVHKRISQCTFHLKGSGWYATDYANSSTKTSSPPEKKNTSSKSESAEAPGQEASGPKASGKDDAESASSGKSTD